MVYPQLATRPLPGKLCALEVQFAGSAGFAGIPRAKPLRKQEEILSFGLLESRNTRRGPKEAP
jgi:hypothetical protein